MKSISLGTACLILYVVFNQNHVQASCKPGTYPNKHMVGSIQCVRCPKKCENEWHGDIDACKKACEKGRSSPSTPVTPSTSPIRTSRVNTSSPDKRTPSTSPSRTSRVNTSPPSSPDQRTPSTSPIRTSRVNTSSPDKRTPSTSPIRTSRVNTSPPSSPDKERNRKNKTTETVVAEVSGLTDADRLAIIIGVLAGFILFLILAVFLIWKNSKSLSVDVKVDEEEAREMCSNSESSDYSPTTNDKRLESDEESESAPECSSEAGSDSGSVQIEATTSNGVPSNDYPSSELCLHESETYF